MEDVPESDVMLDQFNEKLKSSVHLSSYSAIQVLVFYWEEAETTYRDEAQAVRLMFQDTFNYPVTECAIPSSRSYFRVMNVLSEVLATKKAASSLLIIHYGGHGDNDDNRKEGGERRSVWAAESQGGPTLKWYEIQDNLRTSDTDILLLLDCCYAAQAGRDGKTPVRSRFEILAASAMGQTTPPPGKWSFTSTFIKEVKDTINTDGFVKMSDLHAKLCDRTRGLYATPVYIALNKGRRPIRLAPIAATTSQSPVLRDAQDEVFLQLQVQLRQDLNHDTMDQMVEWLGAEVPWLVSGLTILEKTQCIRTAVQDIEKREKAFAQQLDKPSVEDISNAWEEVLLLVAQYDGSHKHGNATAHLDPDSEKQARNQRALKFLRDLDVKNGHAVDVLERCILNGPGMDDLETLNAAWDDDSIQSLGLGYQVHLRRVIRSSTSSPSTGPAVPTANEETSSTSTNILQEIKKYGPYLDPAELPSIEERIRLLVTLLGAPKSSAFRSLHCRGCTHEPLEKRFILEFTVPETLDGSQYLTLRDIITKTRGPNRPTLDARFKIALLLAKAIQKWHSVGWVHQGISGYNIIFFKKRNKNNNTTAQIDYANPILHGFEFARPDQDRSIGRDLDSMELNVYRHPERQGAVQKGHMKKHDLYSLGVVLLEIGLWQNAIDMVVANSSRPNQSQPAMQSVLQKSCRERLAHFAGETYQRAVDACLSSDFGVDFDDGSGSNLARAFQARVVDRLERGLTMT